MALTIFPKLRGTSKNPRTTSRRPADQAQRDGRRSKPFFGGSRSKQGRKPPFSN